jgi:hypothetical protein
LNQLADYPTADQKKPPWLLRLLELSRWPSIQGAWRLLILLGLSAALFVPILDVLYHYGPLSDYLTHAKYIKEWVEKGVLATPHFLNSTLTLAVKAVFPSLEYVVAELIVSGIMYALAAIAVYRTLRWTAPTVAARHPNWLALAGLTLLLVEPITVFTFVGSNLYEGYFHPANVYHNPTILILKPLALVSLSYLVYLMSAADLSPARAWTLAIVLFVLVVLATLAKPNFTMCLVPAAVFACAIDPGLRRSWHAWLAAVMTAIPGILILGWQYVLTYQQPGADSVVVFHPFVMVRDLEHIAWLKFISSIAFAACTLVLYWRRAWQNLALRLAWLTCAVAFLYYYTLAEGGGRMPHDNFGWCCQISLFVLFVVTFGFLLETGAHIRDEKTSPFTALAPAVCWTLYGMHLACGLMMYLLQLNHGFMPWWSIKS